MSEEVKASASETDAKKLTLLLDYKDRLTGRRWIFEREWYRNVLFYIGQQWVVYEETFRRWRMRNLASWVPMPVTNRLASTVNTIRSSVAQVHPAFQARPAQETESAVISANAADKYLDVIVQESGFRAMRRRLASWVTICGNAFIQTLFDGSPETGTVNIPGETCQDCGFEMEAGEIPESMTCPNCGGQNLMENPEKSVDIPQGRLRVYARSPFEVFVDNTLMEMEDQPAIMLVDRKNIDTVRNMYPDVKDLTPDTNRDMSKYYLDSLAYMTTTGFNAGSSFGHNPEEKQGYVTLYQFYVKTCPEYPKGFYAVMSGDQHILEFKEPYPYRFRRTNKPFYPVIHVRYDDVPGRFWAKTPIDDLVSKQRQRNEIESLLQIGIMRTANPVWLVPHGVTTSPISGDPGLLIRYSSVGGAKPERMPGAEMPMSVVKFIEQIDHDFEEIANTFAVMKGKNPGSVRAASAIQMLLERGFGRYGSVFDNLEEAYETWGVQALELWRQNAVFPRVQAVADQAGGWQFLEFLGADLGEIDIRVEAGSTRPKSQAGRQMLVTQGLQLGLLNPNDPEQKMKIYEELGMSTLLPGAELDVKVVAEENAAFMQWAETAKRGLDDMSTPPEQALQVLMATFPLKGDPILDHHPTHMVHHRRFALQDQFRALPDVFKQLYVQHIVQAHMIPMIQEQMTGIGPTGLAAGMMMQAQGQARGGNKQQSVPANGAQPEMGNGPGGAVSPFGAGGRASSGNAS